MRAKADAMPRQLVRVEQPDGDGLRAGVASIRAELEIADAFPPAVLAAADEAAQHPRLPQSDRTDIPLVTIDPEASLDLDQALHIERERDGYRVYYAIADVAAFVEPGGVIDAEANRRGETLYGADAKVPLHPTALSEDAASLLPDRPRPALLWTVGLDASGEIRDAHVERVVVQSREKLSHETAQERLDAGEGGVLTLLGEVGALRQRREIARGGISLPLPQQEIVIDGDRWSLRFRRMLPVEAANAQISLLTGMAAAAIMVRGRVGLLRTVPSPPAGEVDRLRHTARALGIAWPADVSHPDFIRALDTTRPAHAAMAAACARLLRGSGYVAFNGSVPPHHEHAGLAAAYAHVTAPLRRLADRYALEVCVALCAGEPVPAWVVSALEGLPDTMQRSGARASRYENAIINLVEAAMLEPHVGESFTGVVVQRDRDDAGKGAVVIDDPAVEARVTAPAPLPVGADVRVTLVEADRTTRRVRFELGGPTPA